MKIVYIDSSVDGHHVPYIRALTTISSDAVVIWPKEISSVKSKQIICPFPTNKRRTLWGFLKWIRKVKKLADRETPDVVHFLTGDDFYRFFGLGLSAFSKYKTIVTLHWMRNGWLGKASTKCIAKQVDTVVVHSCYIKKELSATGIMNVQHVEYPQFGTTYYKKEEACKYWGIDPSIPLIACIGNTRYDKGLDVLLKALEKIDVPFQLLVAGKAAYFNRTYIENEISNYRCRVKLHLDYLSDEELSLAVSAADIIALPYRKKFDGASGPMVDGVSHSKMIVGPNHGNLGYAIRMYHLGYTFETEDVCSLADAIQTALSRNWEPDEKYKEYKNALSLSAFMMKYQELYKKLARTQ